MKKLLKLFISLIFIQFVLCITNYIYATSTDIRLDGEKTVEPGSTNTISLYIDSSETIGVVSGTIEYSSGISSVSLEASNDWVLTYNKENGKFNIYKATGSSSEEFMKLKYTLSSSANSSQTITIKDIETTTTSYVTNNRGSVSYTINIKESDEENPPVDDDGNDNNNNENNNNSNSNNDKDDNDDSSNNNSNNNSGGTTEKNETSGKGNSSKSPTTSNSKLPYTGSKTFFVIVFVVCIVSIVLFYRYRYYKDI